MGNSKKTKKTSLLKRKRKYLLDISLGQTGYGHSYSLKLNDIVVFESEDLRIITK